MTLKSYLLLSGGTLLATYVLTAQPGVPPEADTARGPAAVRTGAHIDIQQQAERLQLRARHDVEFTAPSRNPFRFGSRPVAPRPAERILSLIHI